MAYLDPNEAFEHFKNKALEGIKTHFPMHGKTQTLHLEKLEVKDALAPDDLKAQKDAKVKGATWSVPVYGHLVLKDNETGKTVDSKRVRLAELPKQTSRYSYIVDGGEYQVDSQWQLKQGAYTRRRQNGQLETRFNVGGRPQFDITFDPAKKHFLMEYGSSKALPIYPLLKTLGISDETLKKSWGEEILEANKTRRGAETGVQAFYKADKGVAAPSKEVAEKHFLDTMAAAKMRPEVNELTLGHPFSTVTGDALHLATAKMIKVQAGAPEDNRDSLVFKDLRTTGDFAYDKLSAGPLKRSILNKSLRKLNTSTDIREIVKFDMFNVPLKQTFSKNAAARLATQLNPLEMVAGSQQTTIMGPGGIQSDNQVMDEAKFVNPSHLGYLDPVHTPEGGKTGVTLRLPIGVRRVGNEPQLPLYNVKTKKMELVGPSVFLTKNVVLPDQVDWSSGAPKPRYDQVTVSALGNAIEKKKFSEADYVMRHSSQLFSMTSNLIPFLGSTSGNRATYGAKQMEQAISLEHREAPLVQVASGVTTPGHHTFEHVVGKQASHDSPVDGTVKSISKDALVVTDKEGQDHKVHLYNNYPLNDSKSFLDSHPLVEVGASVKKGQTVADTNYSREGALALGTNLRVAYLPFKGYNFEDGIVISKAAAKKLSSVHMHRPELQVQEKTILGKKQFQDRMPMIFKPAQMAKLDDEGVVRVGQMLSPGDPVILALNPFELKDRTGGAAIRKALSGHHNDSSVRWDSDHHGEVVSVHKAGDKMTVHVKTIEPAEVGDKLTGRHGNKGIISMVLEDHEMPHSKDGKHIDVALNPSGVPGRMNVGQVLEVAAAKIAQKTGKPYIVHNFEPGKDYLTSIQKELKQHGISDTEELIDPKTKQSLGPVMTGPLHMLKLVHQVEKKSSVRSGMSLPGEPSHESYDINLQPTGGGGIGGQSLSSLGVYSLLAHGAKANLREMQTWKSEGSDAQSNASKRWPSQHHEVWQALYTGGALPTPKPTFAFKKFEELLRAAGVNIEKKGHELLVSPLTDKQILHLSNGRELPKPADLLLTKEGDDGNPKPKPGGLFDERLTGGHGGMKWTHVSLAEPIPNPLFESAIQHVTGLTRKQYTELVHGEKALSPTGAVVEHKSGYLTGGEAIKSLLEKVDVKTDLKKSTDALNAAKSAQKVESLLTRTKYLRALDQMGMKASEAYILHNLPIIPPVMRPITSTPSGTLRFADLNGLYSDFAKLNDQLKDPTLHRNLTEQGKGELRRDYYDGIKAIMGIGIPYADAPQKGILHQIAGPNPKEGYFQDTLVNRKQDLSMRSTIVPEPALGLDEVGLPTHHGVNLFRPFIVKKLMELGTAKTPLQAQEFLAKNPDHADTLRALDKVLAERPILLKRDPALHKYSIQGFHAKRVEGNAIKIHPLVTGGFNADFDGDSIDLDTPIPLLIGGLLCQQTGRELAESLKAGPGNFVSFPANIEAWTYEGWRPVKSVSFHEVRDKKKYKVTLKNGLSFIVSEDHSLMVDKKEVKPGQLACGTVLDHSTDLGSIEDLPNEETWSYDRGVVYGNFLGDGCAEVRRQGGGRVAIACKPLVEREYLMDIWRREFPNANPSQYIHGFHVNGIALAKHFLEVCGRYCNGKYVGTLLLNRGVEFLRGLLAGHILSDGSVELTRSGSYLVRTWSRSKALQDGMSFIATLLGLPHSRRTRIAKGETNHIISFGKEAIKLLDYRCAGKKGELLRQARNAYEHERKDARVSQSARGFEVFSIEEVSYQDRMIDIEVADPQHVFAIHGGVIVHNTMSAFVPISREAIEEAKQMMPTQNLFSEATGRLSYQPSLESLLGLYKLSMVGKPTNKSFAHPGAILEAVQKKSLNINDVVLLEGKKTTAGRVILASGVPAPLQKDLLHNLDTRLDKKGMGTLLEKLGKNHKEDFDVSINRLKDFGNGASFGVLHVPLPQAPHVKSLEPSKFIEIPMTGVGAHSLALKDFQTDKVTRDHFLDIAHAKADQIRSGSLSKEQKDAQVIQAYMNASTKIKDAHEIEANKDPSNLYLMHKAGTKPDWNQYQQMTLAPIIMTDSANRKIPHAVVNSYSEGLDVAGYWTGMHGARRGTVLKVQEVQEPGAITKLMQNSTMHLLVNSHDCGTEHGISMSVNERDIHDRHLAKDVNIGELHVPAGSLLDPQVVGKIRAADKDAQLIVRSPLKCEDPKGICQKCVGLNSNGHHFELGANPGVMASQAIGERAVQLTLKAFHSGGVADQGGGTKLLNGFSRFEELVTLPKKIPNAATLAMVSGKIERIQPDTTGAKIWIAGREHYVVKDPSGVFNHAPAPGATVHADWTPPKVGMTVKAGDRLSDPHRTNINPHDLLVATKNIDKVQNQMSSDIYNLYRDEGVKRRHVEVMVKAISNLTKVKDAGDGEGILRGEFHPTSVIKKMNTELLSQGKAPVVHEPVIKGIKELPFSIHQDWMGKLQYQNIRDTISESAALGAKSNIHGTHPIPGVAYGAEFGLTAKDALKPGMKHLQDVPRHHY